MFNSLPTWRVTSKVCTLADSERYLGHAIRSRRGWTAYDGTRSNAAGDGFQELGAFQDIAEAKRAIEDRLGIWGWPLPGIPTDKLNDPQVAMRLNPRGKRAMSETQSIRVHTPSGVTSPNA